ncbi:MAG TPA: TIGR01777 family oxidoreductase, partial [Myxococcaceae bacterium]|nr:TIGR01777 family oxidoreductase [Myxococcaceae bacterium]
MRIAVTGGTGFIGRALVKRLSREGHQVLALSRHAAKGSSRLGSGVTEDVFDATEPPRNGLLSGCDAVIHLAGESVAARWTLEQKDRVMQSRVRGTRAIAEAALDAKTVKALVCASAIGYYGPRGSEELAEDSPAGGDFLARVCVAWEAAASPARDAGLRTVHLRTGVVLHPEGGALKRMLLPFKLGAGGRLGSGEQYLSWIHRDDLVSLYVYAVASGAVRGPMNATAPNPVTNQEFTSALGRALHRPAILPAPAFAL